jgi:hypothetical protein
MLAFVIVLELLKLIRIMLLLINTAEEPTGKYIRVTSLEQLSLAEFTGE